MEEQIYFQHHIINHGDADEVERNINRLYSDKTIEIIGMTITPYRTNALITLPNGYDICYTYRRRINKQI